MKIYDTVYCNFQVFFVFIYKFFVVNIGENERSFSKKGREETLQTSSVNSFLNII